MDSQFDASQLWDKFLSGDKSSFALIYKLYIKDLTKFGFKITKENDLLDEALQELFVSLWLKRASLAPVKHIKTYLIVSLRNLLLRKIQQAQKTQIYNIDNFLVTALSTESESDTEAELLSKQIQSAIQSLPVRQREALHLKYYQNLSHEEIATIMKINYQSVANLLGRAIHKLKDTWSEKENIFYK